ncbi:MAG: class I SAM-dependent methyltransferase [Pseudomonadales bacterium]|jgi:SAM-dependent methyltransferase
MLTNSNTKNLRQIRLWFDSPIGRQVLHTESAILEQLLSSLFGYHFLQLSVQDEPLFAASPIQHKMSTALLDGDSGPFMAQPAQLPFENDSVDVVLMHHMLDFIASPQDVLREAARVILPSGHLVIIGFNPYSLWGLLKPIAALGKTPPWNGTFIPSGRLMDWMNLLNFKIDRAQYCMYGLPRSRVDTPDYSKGLSRNINWPIGAVYVIVARKQVGAMTPIRPVWKTQKAFGQLSVVPSANRDSHSPEKSR